MATTHNMRFMQDRLPLGKRDYINNHAYFTKMTFNILSYVKNHCPEAGQGRTLSMAGLQYACRDCRNGNKILHGLCYSG